jgi:hypothetical protein
MALCYLRSFQSTVGEESKLTDNIGHSLEMRIIPQTSTTVILIIEAIFTKWPFQQTETTAIDIRNNSSIFWRQSKNNVSAFHSFIYICIK